MTKPRREPAQPAPRAAWTAEQRTAARRFLARVQPNNAAAELVQNLEDLMPSQWRDGFERMFQALTPGVTLEVGYCGNCPWVFVEVEDEKPRWSCEADFDYETGCALEGYGRPLEVSQSPPPDWCRLRKAPVLVQLRLQARKG